MKINYWHTLCFIWGVLNINIDDRTSLINSLFKVNTMKKLLLASLITGASFTATASVITFDDSSFNGTPGSEVVFDFIDYDTDRAQVSQTDTDGNGFITGVEAFSEMGSTDVVNFKLGSDLLGVDAAYEVFYNYDFSGVATTGADGKINVVFDSGNSGLYVDTTTVGNNVFDGPGTQLASFSFGNGGCSIDTVGPLANKGFCVLNLDINFAAGYFFNKNGEDLSTTAGKKTAELVVTVQDIFGLNFAYDEAFGTQEFEVLHDGNMKLSVPEPASIAILGLGLLGFAGARRRKA